MLFVKLERLTLYKVKFIFMRSVFLPLFSILLVVFSVFTSCKSKQDKGQVIHLIEVDSDFSAYVDEYSSGVISGNGAFQVKLSPGAVTAFEQRMGSIDKAKLFEISPSVKGECSYADGTLSYKPSEALKEGTEYVVSFQLKNILPVPAKLDVLKFNVFTLKRNFSVSLSGLRTGSAEKANEYSLEGELKTSVAINSEDIEKLVEAQQSGSNLKIEWEHRPEENLHLFSIKNIERKRSASSVKVSWDGDVVDVNNEGKQEIEIPATGDFRLLETRIIQQPEQQVKLYFSDALDSKQDLEGLVEVKASAANKLAVDGNQVTVYLGERLSGICSLDVNRNIRNKEGQSLPQDYVSSLEFQLQKPQLRLPGKGVIMPDNGSVIFPFEAVNVKAVDLRIVKIYSSNMNSFLQNSQLGDTYDLKRVGRLIFSKRVDLVTDQVVDLNKWNAFSLDLSKYVTIEKGSIYEVEIGMQKEYSVYPCQDGEPQAKKEDEDDYYPRKEPEKGYDSNKALTAEKEYWDDPDTWENGYYDRYYNWRLHDNPCSRAYYTADRNIKRNILVSNIGLTVKKGLGNEVLVACSDLKAALPLQGVKLEILNYQLQNIGTGSSDGDGFASILVAGKPFLLVASQNDQKSYLKLNESNALSLSQFDVSGEKSQQGLKAFLYGERGAWRPGDSIYVSVFVDDRNAPLPENHPVNFKLINTKGQIIQEQLKPLDKKKLLTFRTATSPDAETGIWKALVSIGGAEFTKHLRIETIKPNRLKINATFSHEVIGSDDQSATARIESAWLTGVNAPSLRTIVELGLRAEKTRFESFPLFNFDDPSKVFKFETKTILDGRTDEAGNLSFPVYPGKITDAPGILSADYTVRIFEPGGDASIRQFSRKFSPYAKYAGLQIPSSGQNKDFIKVDDQTPIKLVSVSATGQAVSDRIQLMIYKMEWRWWWESSDQNMGSYINRNNARLILSKDISLNGSPVTLSEVFKPLEWGRYMVVAQSASGHTSAMTVFNKPDYYYGEGAANQATMLTFTADKKSYQTGDEIHVSFPAPDKGRALVTIEDGTKILDKFWVNTAAGNNDLAIKATAAMAPCSYIHISLIQPYGQRNNDNPIRMYGVIPVPVEDPDSRLSPVLKIADEVRPEKEISMTVSEKSGKAMNYTIAMVDEGLLDITGFATPDPWSGIYQREALGVKTWDLFDDVLGAFGGRLEKLFAIGGDMSPVDPAKNKANRFKPVVHFEGPFRLEKGQSRTHSFKLPPYNGSVRTMVIAGNDGAFGSTEKTSKVKSPLMLLPVAPRSIGFDEDITIPVSVFAQSANLKNVQVKITCSEHFKIASEAVQTVNFTQEGEKTVDFRIKSEELSGVGTIILTATSGNESTKYELNIPVKSRDLPISKTVTKMVSAGQTDNFTLAPFGVRGSNKAIVTVSGLPSANLSSRLEYLIQYPHGCTEQTVSSVFPQLFLAGIQELSAEQKTQISNHIQAGITQLKKHQNVDGSFAFWPGMASNDEWLTSYVGHFFSEAEAKGFSIPADMKKRWLAYQSRIASEWKGTHPYQKVVQAYRLYTLALAGKPVFSAMNRLREDKDLPTSGRWFLAGAYAEGARPEAAYELINMMDISPKDDFNAYTYGNQTRDRAMLLLCMVRLKDQNNMLTLYKRIAEELNSDEWMSTQTTSFALSGICKTMEFFKASGKGMNFTFTNGKASEVIKTTASFKTVLSGDLAADLPVSVKNTSEGTLFVDYYTEGIPKAGQSVKIDRKLETTVKFMNSNRVPVDIANLKQGTDLMAVVTVSNKSIESVGNLALTFQVPSGWEIRNTRMYNQVAAAGEDPCEYRDFRDDKVCTYFSLSKGQTKTFTLLMNASYLGKFYFPNIQTEAMYDKSYLSVVPGRWVEVVK